MYVLLGDMLIPDIKDQIYGFFFWQLFMFIVDPNIFRFVLVLQRLYFSTMKFCVIF